MGETAKAGADNDRSQPACVGHVVHAP
jgi:hypothetical protein